MKLAGTVVSLLAVSTQLARAQFSPESLDQLKNSVNEEHQRNRDHRPDYNPEIRPNFDKDNPAHLKLIEEETNKFFQYLSDQTDVLNCLNEKSAFEKPIRKFLTLFTHCKMQNNMRNPGGNQGCKQNDISILFDILSLEYTTLSKLPLGFSEVTIEIKDNTPITLYMLVENVEKSQLERTIFRNGGGDNEHFRAIEIGIKEDDQHYPLTIYEENSYVNKLARQSYLADRAAIINCHDEVPRYSSLMVHRYGQIFFPREPNIILRESSDLVSEKIDLISDTILNLPKNSNQKFKQLFFLYKYFLSSVFPFEGDEGGMATRMILEKSILQFAKDKEIVTDTTLDYPHYTDNGLAPDNVLPAMFDKPDGYAKLFSIKAPLPPITDAGEL